MIIPHTCVGPSGYRLLASLRQSYDERATQGDTRLDVT
jgi:hypothetical protein